MSKLNDLTGKRFGRLKVESRAPNRHGKVSWNCVCDCGNRKIVTSDNLRTHTRSCGCYHIQRITESNKKYNAIEMSGDISFIIIGNSKIMIDTEDLNKVKDIRWRISSNGYPIGDLKDKRVFLHRVVVDYVPSGMEVDHINHNLFDARKSNLRIVSRSQNNMNHGIKSNNTSGITGVWFSNQKQKWVAEIKVLGKKIHLGTFTNINDATEARAKAEKHYFGEYAYDRTGHTEQHQTEAV